MPNQPNMYRGVIKKAERVLDKIKECAVLYTVDDEGNYMAPLGIDSKKAKEYYREISKIEGELSGMIRGLKEGRKKEEYEEYLSYCEEFLNEVDKQS